MTTQRSGPEKDKTETAPNISLTSSGNRLSGKGIIQETDFPNEQCPCLRETSVYILNNTF